jgi:hypothetical protein
MLAIGLSYILYNIETFRFLFLISSKLWLWIDLEFCQRPFLHLLICWCGFCPWFRLCVVLCLLIYRCCTILLSQNEIYLLVVYDLFNVSLDSISKYFIEDFWIFVHPWYWHITFFFDTSLPGIRVILFSSIVFGSIFSFCTLWNNLRSTGVSSSLKVCSYSGGTDQEDHGSKLAWANDLWDSSQKRAGGRAQSVGPEFKPLCWRKKKKTSCRIQQWIHQGLGISLLGVSL